MWLTPNPKITLKWQNMSPHYANRYLVTHAGIICKDKQRVGRAWGFRGTRISINNEQASDINIHHSRHALNGSCIQLSLKIFGCRPNNQILVGYQPCKTDLYTHTHTHTPITDLLSCSGFAWLLFVRGKHSQLFDVFKASRHLLLTDSFSRVQHVMSITHHLGFRISR